MAGNYDHLYPAEADTYDEYTRLRQLSDWDGFDDRQVAAKRAAGAWIDAKCEQIRGLAEGTIEGTPGWDTYNRQSRYDYLMTTGSGAPHALCQLPTDGGTSWEKAAISEREMWWRIPSTEYSEQSARRQACTDALVARRKYVWNLAEGNVDGETPGWDHADRRRRYSNLQIATKYGSAYDDWCKTHNQTTGAPKGGDAAGSGSSDSRDVALSWMANRRGCYESPGGSNCDNRSDGIRTAQERCASWVVGEPWCGTWCFNAMDAAGVRDLSSNIASVAWIEDQARAGRAPFTGWTTDGDQARPGDLVVMFGYGGHVGMLRKIESGSSAIVEEGNTSDTSAQRTRSRTSDIRGYAKVAYP